MQIVDKTKSNIALICARGGSKGLARKNLKRLGDKSLVAHAIDIALKCPSIHRVLVSTDCTDIANEAKNYGAEVPFIRRPELATDTAPEWDVWKDAIKWLSSNDDFCDAMVMLSPTAPLRSVENVEKAIQIFYDKPCDGVISVAEAQSNPFFNMITIEKNGQAKIGMVNHTSYHRRQDAPSFYNITTVCYVMKPSYVLENNHLFDGILRCNHIAPENAVDIDTHFDFMLAEAVMERTKLSNAEKIDDC